jgi:nitrous-oxide reductase
LEKTASAHDRDYAIAVNWRKAAEAAAGGAGQTIGDVRVIDPAEVPGLAYLVPVAKSPHGVDFGPDGTFFVTSGKLEAITTAFSFDRMLAAIQNQDFSGEEDGIPVLSYDSRDGAGGAGRPGSAAHPVRRSRLRLHQPVHRQRHRQVEPGDRRRGRQGADAYNIGHLMIPGGRFVSPTGNYLIALNKLSHGRHLNVGPSQPESSQLIDITGEKMKLLYDAFTEPEPHYAQAIQGGKLKPDRGLPKEENQDPWAVWDVKPTPASPATATRWLSRWSRYARPSIPPLRGPEGDTVTIHITNIEQTTDELHGLGINGYNINLVVDPGETKHVTFTADKTGVFAYYCTNFCSALHQEMQGYLMVR